MEINVSDNTATTISLGNQGENNIRHVVFDYSQFAEQYGEGSLTLVVQRSRIDTPYPVVLDIEGHKATWTISNTDTAIAGKGNIQLHYVVDGKIKKSAMYRIKTEPSIILGQDTPPEPYESYINHMVEIKSDIEAIAEEVHSVRYTDDGDGNITMWR